jgi:hypothetical protein
MAIGVPIVCTPNNNNNNEKHYYDQPHQPITYRSLQKNSSIQHNCHLIGANVITTNNSHAIIQTYKNNLVKLEFISHDT